jgi:small subunit ribosomal protein S6
MGALREYETIFVLDSSLDPDSIEGEINKVVQTISDNAGSVHEVQRWGRRRLAYPIRKKNDGVYTRIRFDGNNTVLSELDRKYQVNEQLLRYMTVVIDHPYVEPRTLSETEGAEEGRKGPGRRASWDGDEDDDGDSED